MTRREDPSPLGLLAFLVLASLAVAGLVVLWLAGVLS